MKCKDRIDRLRQELIQKNIDAMLITSRHNIEYYSGFTGTESYIFISKDKQFVFTDSRYTQQAKQQTSFFTLNEYKGDAYTTICDVINNNSIKNIGFDDKNMTFSIYNKFSEKLTSKLVPTGDLLNRMRMKKDEDELFLIEQAVNIADRAFEHIINYIKPGVIEREVAAQLEFFMKKEGAQGIAFDTIVASGARSSLPHGVASMKAIESGDAIILDYGAIYKGYCSDISRTVFVGKPDPELLDIYKIVLRAQTLAQEEAQSKMEVKQIDMLARQHINDCGYGDFFGHGLGHGIGLEIHEEPGLSPYRSGIMEDDMVVTMEPGIYLPNKGGVRIEDVVVFINGRPKILTKASKEIITL